MIEDMLAHNRRFVAEGQYHRFATSKYPDKKIAIVTCMDTRLVELLPAALDIHNGDVKMIKNAGGMITDPYDSTMRSVLIAVYELGVRHIMIIGHTTCGVRGMEPGEMLHLMREHGVSDEAIAMVRDYSDIDLDKWLTGFDDTAEAVRRSVALVKGHPLLAPGIEVSGWVMDTVTGELNPA